MTFQGVKEARILIIDDEKSIRTMLRDVLESEGHTVIEAPNGTVAMQHWRAQSAAQPIDLIITDILMPDKDGIEVIREIRRLAPDMKIIAISGGSPQVNMRLLEIANRLGAYRTIDKPFGLNVLLDAVRAALSQEYPPKSA